jgi:hypothetical protein
VLTLLDFAMGLPIWLFSTLVILNSPFPYSPVTSYSLSSSSSSEILDASDQEAKKKKKRENKKKKNKQGGNQPTTIVSVDNVGNPTNIGRKPKFLPRAVL